MTGRWSGRRRALVALVALGLVGGLVLGLAMTRRDDPDEAVRGGVHGPLCQALPAGDDPGSPSAIAGLDASAALTWIPVLTVFEAATRAAGLTAELGEADGITILAPSDDAFLLAMTQETLDELIISRQDELRRLVEAHVVDGERSVADLIAAGTVTAWSGDTFTVAASEGEARLADRAGTVCSDYRVANAAIHVIDGVLGELPASAEPGQPVSG